MTGVPDCPVSGMSDVPRGTPDDVKAYRRGTSNIPVILNMLVLGVFEFLYD